MSRRWNLLAWSILGSVFLGMSVYLLLNPTRTGVVPNYRMAATNWWEGWKVYGYGTHGFLYFPQFIVLFTPFNLVRPQVLGEILWRLAGFSFFVGALWRLQGLFRATKPGADWIFLALTLLAVPASLASINNGQTNLPLSACLVLSALCLREERWWWASIFLTVCVILKPIGLAPGCLAFAVFPQVRARLAACFGVFLLIGFVHLDPGYVFARWEACLKKILHSYRPENLRVSDLFGMLGKAGWSVPILLETVVRASACLAALAWVWQAFRRQGLAGASWVLWVATALVFTVFNPRAETNSYVLISPLLAFAAIGYWRGVEGDKWKGWVLAAACIGLMCDGMGRPIYKATDVWFKPLLVLLVSPLLFRMPESWKSEAR